MNEREIIELADACGRRACDSEHHHGCPYGDESMVDCVERLEQDYETAIQRLLVLADANTEEKSLGTTYTCIDREHNTWAVCGVRAHGELRGGRANGKTGGTSAHTAPGGSLWRSEAVW